MSQGSDVIAERARELVALGRAIRRVREERGMDPDALAAAAGIDQGAST
jgi:hypothetical protein